MPTVSGINNDSQVIHRYFKQIYSHYVVELDLQWCIVIERTKLEVLDKRTVSIKIN